MPRSRVNCAKQDVPVHIIERLHVAHSLRWGACPNFAVGYSAVRCDMRPTSRAARLRCLFAVVCTQALVSAATAHAQDAAVCAPPLLGPIEVFPASGATATIDAPVRVRYSPGFLAGIRNPEELFTLARTTTSGAEPVRGRAVILGDWLTFVPDSLFLAGATYRGTASGADVSLTFTFTALSRTDCCTPTFPTGAKAEIRSTRVAPRCDLPAGGYRVDVAFPPASDDGPLGDVEYLLVVTRIEGGVGPDVRSRVRNFATSRVTGAITITASEAERPVCVGVVAIDGVGRQSAIGEECFDPISGNFFAGCGVVSAASRVSWATILAGLFVLFYLCRSGLFRAGAQRS